MNLFADDARLPVVRRVAERGGVAATRDLLGDGVSPGEIELAAYYRLIVKVRHGWWAVPGAPTELVRARFVGGRLACASALAFRGLTPEPRELHVEVPRSASRLRPDPESEVVTHWTRYPEPGDAHLVSLERAWRQRSRCRALSPDSL